MLWKLGEEKADLEYQERILKEEISKKSHLQLLNTLEWTIPIESFEVPLVVTTITRIDALKKMVMGILLKMKIKNINDIKEFLKVDPLFIADVLEYLQMTGLATIDEDRYRLTELGKTQYEAGTILSNPSIETITFDYCPEDKTIVKSESKNDFIKADWELKEYRYRTEPEDIHGKMLEESELRKIIQESGQVFEVGGKEKVIIEIGSLNRVGVKHAKCIEFQLYDVLEDKAYSRVWNGAKGSWDRSLEEEIDAKESEEWKAKYITAISERFPERYELLKKKIELATTQSTKETSIDIIRGAAIRQRFDNSFKDTRQKMLMVSPWISENVVDREMFKTFESFASKNKTLYISWGIAKDPSKETRRPSDHLLNRISNIKHEDGTRAIFIRWFGNQHNKEIVIDNQVLLLGSYNWLSYRGDYDLRQESVLEVNDPSIINKTTAFIEDNFVQALETELQQFLQEDADFSDPLLYKNWMKELILLSSFSEKRKELSKELIAHLEKNEQDKIIHELAVLWALNRSEEYGVASHLSNLIQNGPETEAQNYYELCRKHIGTFEFFKNSPELFPHIEWIEEQNRSKSNSQKKVTANGKPKKTQPPKNTAQKKNVSNNQTKKTPNKPSANNKRKNAPQGKNTQTKNA